MSGGRIWSFPHFLHFTSNVQFADRETSPIPVATISISRNGKTLLDFEISADAFFGWNF